MNTIFGVRGMVGCVGACVAVLVSGCGVESDPGVELGGSGSDLGGSSESVGEAQEALTYTQDGFKVTWTYVGHPWAARKIAACGPSTIYALNYDFHLYLNGSSGNDNTWSHVNYAPSAREIACNDVFLYALNYDKNLYSAYVPGGSLVDGWVWVDKPSQAEHIASGGDQVGGGDVFALNTNKTIWTSEATGLNTIQWTFRNTASQADRVTGAGSHYSANRAFALNTDKSLWYNDKLFVSSSGANWHSFPNGGLSLLEISAGAPDVLYGLTTTYDLWKATITEDNCSDGIDNNSDGESDAYDATCVDRAGNTFCATHATGNYCYSRFSGNTRALARCAGGALAGVDYGDWCNLVGSGGQDYVGRIQ